MSFLRIVQAMENSDRTSLKVLVSQYKQRENTYYMARRPLQRYLTMWPRSGATSPTRGVNQPLIPFDGKTPQKQFNEYVSRNDSKAFLSIHQMVVLNQTDTSKRINFSPESLANGEKVLNTSSSFVKERAHSVLRGPIAT
jgi:hypothetical protein